MSDKPTCALTRAADIIEAGIAWNDKTTSKQRIGYPGRWHFKHTRQLVKDLRKEAEELNK